MPTKAGKILRTLFVGLVYVLIYESAQIASAYIIGLSEAYFKGEKLTITEFSAQYVVGNAFIATLAAMSAAGVIYILLSILRERPPSEDISLRPVKPSEAIIAVTLAIFLRIAVGVYTEFSEYVPALRDSVENVPDTTAAMDSPFKILLGLFAVYIAAPVFEEILFRGFVQGEFMRGMPAAAAIILSSLVFAAAHGILFQSVFTFFVGLCMGYAYYKTGSLFTSIIIHIAFNSTSAVQFLFAFISDRALIIVGIIALAAIAADIFLLSGKGFSSAGNDKYFPGGDNNSNLL